MMTNLNHSIKSKCLKWVLRKIKSKETGKKSGTAYCLNSVVCLSSKSRFLKQKNKNKKQIAKLNNKKKEFLQITNHEYLF